MLFILIIMWLLFIYGYIFFLNQYVDNILLGVNIQIIFGLNYNIEDSICECVNGQDKCYYKVSIFFYGYVNEIILFICSFDERICFDNQNFFYRDLQS